MTTAEHGILHWWQGRTWGICYRSTRTAHSPFNTGPGPGRHLAMCLSLCPCTLLMLLLLSTKNLQLKPTVTHCVRSAACRARPLLHVVRVLCRCKSSRAAAQRVQPAPAAAAAHVWHLFPAHITAAPHIASHHTPACTADAAVSMRRNTAAAAATSCSRPPCSSCRCCRRQCSSACSMAAAGLCVWVQQAVESLACCCLQCIQLVGLAHA
jgi:hypothetical protein